MEHAVCMGQIKVDKYFCRTSWNKDATWRFYLHMG